MNLNFENFFIPNRINWEEISNIREKQTHKKEIEELKKKNVICPKCKKIMILNEETTITGHGEWAYKLYYKCTNCYIETKKEYARSNEEILKALKKLQK